ncbi:MAG: LysR substrate-binding domain-containing protein [Deltaproteobacteria bacterium]
MQITQLRTFYEVVKSGSYSKASEKLFITQSAVSHQIRNLEKEFNMKLFERLGNNMKLTKGGEILSDAIAKFLDDLDNLKKLSEDIRTFKTGDLTVATTSALMIYILPEVVKKFREEFPRIKFKLISRISVELLPPVLSGEADLAIAPKPDKKELVKLKFIKWKSFGIVLLLAKGHPLQKKKTIMLDDICKLPLILYRSGTVIRQAVDAAFTHRKLSYEVMMEIDMEENAKKYVGMGIGATITASFAVTAEDQQRLWCVDVSHLFGKVDEGIYYRKNKYVTEAMQRFINLFLSQPLSSSYRPFNHLCASSMCDFLLVRKKCETGDGSD